MCGEKLPGLMEGNAHSRSCPPVNSFDLVTEIRVVGSNEKVTEHVSSFRIVVSLGRSGGSRLPDVQGRRDGLAPLLIGREEPSAPLEGFLLLLRVVKLGAEALDVNAMTPGRFCPAFLIDRPPVVVGASLSAVADHPLGLGARAALTEFPPRLCLPPDRTVGSEAGPPHDGGQPH